MSHIELKIVLLLNADIIPLNEKVNFLLDLLYYGKVIETNDGINWIELQHYNIRVVNGLIIALKLFAIICNLLKANALDSIAVDYF